jgi:RNA polymerase sigma-70 factor (ECF subfamily)
MSGAAPGSEREMAALLRQGEVAAIEWLYEQYGRLALGLAYRIVRDDAAAEDVVQDAFLAVWRNAKAFDADRGSLRTWLLAIVRNRAIDHVRGATRLASFPPPLWGSVRLGRATPAPSAEQFPDAWEAVSLELERKQVREALESLPQQQRESLELAYFEGLSQSEIADRTKLPLGTVKSRMRLGLEKIRSFLQARGLEP